MKAKIKSSRKETLATGLGQYPTNVPRAMDPNVAVEFVSGFCVCPELGQDIKNVIGKAIDAERRKRQSVEYMAFAAHSKRLIRGYGVRCELVESHKLLRMSVTVHTKATDSDTFTTGRVIAYINLRLTPDGLIADFYPDEELPKYNPANFITVIDRSEAHYH